MSPLVQSFRTCVPALAGLLLALSATAASAAVKVRIDNSSQRMRVYVDGGLAHAWPVSTARRGYRTPAGHYRVQRMERMWYSRKYHMSPMPYSLFFAGGYAIHGTSAIRQLGRPASHGCVRLHPANARALFALVRSRGGASVVITN
jgi:lipoprotein-anchoring transpeptidase ErfK/SrfK